MLIHFMAVYRGGHTAADLSFMDIFIHQWMVETKYNV